MYIKDKIIAKIKEKKELSGIDNSIIAENLEEYLFKHKLRLEQLGNKEIKLIIKDVRSVLRKKVGRFHLTTKDRGRLFNENKISSLLKSHTSTKERLEFYPQLKEIIKKLKVNSILDLGCGINPIALASPGIKYYAADINLEDLDLVKKYFHKNNIEGEVFFCDLNNIQDCRLPDTDLSLILKVFDILGKENYRLAKNILERIHSKHIIISFSTRTLSGKPMNRPRRVWFEKLLESMFYKFEILKSDNEIFYII
ncbi:MAG: hypothetical protein QXS38_00525 [Candidatus Pacearchaeota archaeon]